MSSAGCLVAGDDGFELRLSDSALRMRSATLVLEVSAA